MLPQPRQHNFNNNMNSSNINLQPHHGHNNNMNSSNINLQPHHCHNNNGHNLQLAQQSLSGFTGCYSPRPGQRSKVPPNITICPPGDHKVMTSRYLNREELDNDVFQPEKSQTSCQSSGCSYTGEKQEVCSGKLYIIRNTGSASSAASSPTRSPAKSLYQGSSAIFRSTSPPTIFRSFSPSCAHQCSRQSSPTSSPQAKSRGKTTVMVKVYRCNLDHFAVISRDMLYPGKPVFVNLRHSRVMPGQTLGRFVVTGKSDSGHVIEFETPELSSLEQWLDAFQVYTPPASPNRIGGESGIGLSCGTPPVPRSSALPTVTETEED